jgi:hypothetical protein
MSAMGRVLSNFHATTHPSQPNYIAMVAGDFLDVVSNDNLNLEEEHVGDLLDKKGVSWISYQEDFPGNCSLDTVKGNYVRKHNPFISFSNVKGNKARCDERIVNQTQFEVDMASGNVPGYMFYTPNMQNDGHDTSVSFAGAYLKVFMDKNLKRFPPRTLVVITFDEDDDHMSPNRVLTILIGDMIQNGTENSNCYHHYSLLRLVEDNWDLGTLGRNDADFDAIDLNSTSTVTMVGSCGLTFWPLWSVLIDAAIAFSIFAVLLIVGVSLSVCYCKKNGKFCYQSRKR